MAQLTIVIPVYNRAEIVRRTLNSVAAQTLRPLSVVLVDNNSSDRTLEVLNAWKQQVEAPDFKIEILSEKKPGACAARNAGLQKVETEWTMFFDSDDIMLPNHAARAMKAIENNPDADVAGWDFRINFANGKCRTVKFYLHDCIYNNIMHCTFSTPHYVARTELFRRVGGWNENIGMYDDCELGTRILLTNPKLIRVEGENTVEVYESDLSITNNSGSRADSIRPGLDAIRNDLPAHQRHWVDLQHLIKLSSWASKDPKTPIHARQILSRQPFLRRILWRILYEYSLRGGHGVARLYRPLSYLGL